MLREGLNYSTASGRASHYWQSKNVFVTTKTGALELAVQAESELSCSNQIFGNNKAVRVIIEGIHTVVRFLNTTVCTKILGPVVVFV